MVFQLFHINLRSVHSPFKKKNKRNTSCTLRAEFERANDYVTSKMCLAWGQHKYCFSLNLSHHFQLEHGHSPCSTVFVPTNNKNSLARNELVRSTPFILVDGLACSHAILCASVKSNKNCIISAGILQFLKRFTHFPSLQPNTSSFHFRMFVTLLEQSCLDCGESLLSFTWTVFAQRRYEATDCAHLWFQSCKIFELLC